MNESLQKVEHSALAWQEILAVHWPKLFERLSDRAPDYLDAAKRKAMVYQFEQEEVVARYVNLCCAFGPNFEDKPDNEWALAVLADERLVAWVKLHQLVLRAADVLGRRSDDGRQVAAQFLRADAELVDFHDALLRAADSDALPLTRVACDLEAIDIRVLETNWRREYSCVEQSWQLVNVPETVSSVRIGSGRPAPLQICVLSHVPKMGPLARLQVRVLTHSRCDQDRHPLVSYAGNHGLSQWRGHLAQAVSWQLPALLPGEPDKGMGASFLEETQPDAALLRASSCGVRDDGVPTGPFQTHVWSYPADQYLLTIQREAGDMLSWPKRPGDQSNPEWGITSCHLERDGSPVNIPGWNSGFQERLQHSIFAGLDKLFAAWQLTTRDSAMNALVALMVGRSAITWGWRESADGLAERPFLRVVGDLDLNHIIDVQMVGEIEQGLTRSRLRLTVKGDVPMKRLVKREGKSPGLFEVIPACVSKWQLGFHAEFDPIAVEDAALVRDVGPCTGFLNGEVGIRPKVTGGNGWEWYSRISTEPVYLPICIHDPVLGLTQKTLSLLPGITLLDWSLG